MSGRPVPPTWCTSSDFIGEFYLLSVGNTDSNLVNKTLAGCVWTSLEKSLLFRASLQNCSIRLKLYEPPRRHVDKNSTCARAHRSNSLSHNFSLFLYKSVHRNRTPANLLDDFRKQRWQFVCAVFLHCFFFFLRQPAQEHSCTFSTARDPWQGNQWLSQPRTSPARTPLIHQDMLKVITSDLAPLLHTFSQSWSTAHARAK